MKKKAIGALKDASEDLLYPSESDEPFETFSWGKAEGELTATKVRHLAGAPAGAKVQEVPIDEFFHFLTQEVEGAADEEAPDKFKRLSEVVRDQLAGAMVFRVGKVNIDIYVVGKTKEGEWAGLKTKAVET